MHPPRYSTVLKTHVGIGRDDPVSGPSVSDVLMREVLPNCPVRRLGSACICLHPRCKQTNISGNGNTAHHSSPAIIGISIARGMPTMEPIFGLPEVTLRQEYNLFELK